jgi:hypothetical protein
MGDGVWGGFTVKPMKLKLQGPLRGPSIVFTWSYIFEKFAEIKVKVKQTLYRPGVAQRVPGN